MQPLNPSGVLRVLVATPLGRHGRGGIDRMMDAVAADLERAPRPDLQVRFAVTRGQGHISAAPLHLARALIALAVAPDVLHVNLSSNGSAYRKWLLCRAARARRVPYVLHLHGSGFREFYAGASAPLAAEIRDMFDRAARVLVLGETWRDWVCARAPRACGAAYVLRNATASRPDRQPSTDPVTRLLFLGQVGKRKGVPVLLDALEILADEPGWRAVIAGDGDVATGRSRIERIGLADRVTLPGWVGPRETTRLLAEADILTLPSFKENLPMSVIEGMAFGLAVVATPAGATEEIVEQGRTGLLVPPGDAVALSQALRRLIGDRELQHRLGVAAQQFQRRELEIGGYVDRLADHWRQAAISTR